MKYGILGDDNKFLIIDENLGRITTTITKHMPQFNAADVKGYADDEVEQGYDGIYYLKGFAPEKPALTHEEVKELRKQYRSEHCDYLTSEKIRKSALSTWTEQDEADYVKAMQDVDTYLNENLPYPLEAVEPEPDKSSEPEGTETQEAPVSEENIADISA